MTNVVTYRNRLRRSRLYRGIEQLRKLIDQFAQSHRAADLARVHCRDGSTGLRELLDAERVEFVSLINLPVGESSRSQV